VTGLLRAEHDGLGAKQMRRNDISHEARDPVGGRL
jgi:hypothetical protein